MAAAPAGPRAGHPRLGYSLRDRLLLFALGIVVLLLGLSLGVIDAFVRGQVRRLLVEELVTTRAVFESFLEQRSAWLRAQSQVVAEDPRFSATLDLPDPDRDSQARTVQREARHFQSILGSDLFLVTDADGRALARLEVSRTSRLEARAPAPGPQGPPAEVWRVAGRDFRVATVSVEDAGRPVGFLAAGVAVGGEDPPIDGEDLERLSAEAAVGSHLAGAAPEDLHGLLARLQEELFRADLLAVTAVDGSLLQAVVRQVSSGQGLADLPSVAAALEGEQWAGLLVEGHRLFHAVTVPVWSPDRLVGSLTTGFEIDDELADDLRAMTHSHVSFFDEGRRLVASTWDRGLRGQLEAGFLQEDSSDVPFDLVVAGETFLTLVGHFGPEPSAGDAARGTYLIQRSLDEAFAFLHTLERVLLAVGVGVLALGVALSFVGARRITRPVEALVEGTRRLAAGQLDHRIVERSRSELGELANSFNDMAASLRTSREALEESERAYRDLFDNAQDLVYTTDLERRITSVNRAGLDFLGYSHEQLRGRSLYDLIAPADRQRVVQREAAAVPGAPRPPYEAAFLRHDGRQATFEVVSRWIVAAGQPVGVHAIGRDITQRRERERATIRFREQLAQAEKLRALGEMAAGVAHNFNNLLTVVVGNAELISLHEDVPEPIRADTERILESARRCSAIVRRIQTFGRPIDMDDTAPVDLAQVVRDIVDITRPKWKTGPELAGHSISVRLDLQPVPPILSQGSAWEEILSNLIFNAVDAMPEGGAISISTRQEDGAVAIRVADTGTGMDAETQRRIFEPFFSTKAEGAGTGLGLSTVWGLLQALGGEIAVDSSLGAGTTFTIRMPVAGDGGRAAAAGAGGPGGRGLRVLVVDDEPRVLELLPPILAGHDVDTAAGGGEGLRRVRSSRYDVVISDWVMSDASGLEIADAVRASSPDSVMVLMTGWELRGSPAASNPAVDLQLSKPFEREDVERVMAEAVRLRLERAGVA